MTDEKGGKKRIQKWMRNTDLSLSTKSNDLLRKRRNITLKNKLPLNFLHTNKFSTLKHNEGN